MTKMAAMPIYGKNPSKSSVKHLWNGGIYVYLNYLVQMTKMAAMPIYGKNPSKIISESGGTISKKLGMKHQWLKYYNVYINHDPVVTLTYFTRYSNISSETTWPIEAKFYVRHL